MYILILGDQKDEIANDTVHVRDDIECYNTDMVPSGVLQNDHAFINSLETILEANTTIQDIGTDEAIQPAQDQSTTIALGFFNPITDNLEFYFENGENMAKIVGVGLHYGKAIVKPGFIIEAQETEKEEWEKIWFGVKAGLDTTIRILKVKLPSAARAQVFKNVSTSSHSRQRDDSSILATSSSNVGFYQERSFNASHVPNYTFQVPILWELSKYFIIRKVVDAFYTKCNVRTFGESSEVHSTQDYPEVGCGTGSGTGTINNWEETLKELFSNMRVDPHNNQGKQGGSGDGNDEGDGGDGRRQGKAATDLLKDKLNITKVSIKLRLGGDFFDEKRQPLSDQLEPSSL